MTVFATDPPYSQYTGTGERTFYEYGWDWQGEPVYVEVNGLPVTFTQQSTGVVLDSAPILGASILIYRKTDITQERDFTAFDSFDAHWTEDALDKLILLKQEAGAYRAKLNLAVNRTVERVRLLNDKGTDPDIFIWNTDMAGVFSGEATNNPPLIGSFVDKPDDFVYLIWGDPFKVQEFTTTLYPVESSDAVTFNPNLTYGYMEEIETDEGAWSHTFVDAERFQILIEFEEGPDEAEWSHTFIDAERFQVLIEFEEGPDEAEWSHTFIDAERITLLITAYKPEHGLITDVDIDAANCSLDPI